MIINGRSRRCVWWWSKHLQNEDENERVRLVKAEGLVSENIHDLLCEIEGQGLGTRCKNPMWIAVLNPGPNERLNEQDWERAREILEQERGYQGQPYFVVEHEKNGWTHRHVIYSRIDAEHMRVLPDSLDAKICHAAARKIEVELGLEKVVGPFDREKGAPRPARAPEPWEMYRGMVTQIDPRDITAEVTELFRQSRNGVEFVAALTAHGYQLATGKRGLLILDTAGKEHSLARRIDGVNAKELNAFMRDVDRQELPTVEQAKEHYQERKIAGWEADRATVAQEIAWEETLVKAAIEKEKSAKEFVEPEERISGKRHRGAGADGREKEWPVMPPAPEPIRTAARYHFEDAARSTTRAEPEPVMPERLRGTPAEIWSAWQRSDSARAFTAALDEQGIALAVVTKEEAARSHMDAEFARAVGNYALRYREGEIVAISPGAEVYRLNKRTTGESPARVEKFLASLDRSPLQGIEATKQIMHDRAEQREAATQLFSLLNPVKPREIDTTPTGRPGRGTDGNENLTIPPAAIGNAAARTVGKLFDVAATALESLLAPALTPEQIHEGQKAIDQREAEAEHRIDFSSYTAEMAQKRQQEEQERAAARERQRDGRER